MFRLAQNVFSILGQMWLLNLVPTRRYNRVLRRACPMTGLQACPRGCAPLRRAQGRERVLVLPHLFALLHWLQSPLWGSWIFEGVPALLSLNLFCSACVLMLRNLPQIYLSPLVSSKGGAGITQTSAGEKNVALSFIF